MNHTVKRHGDQIRNPRNNRHGQTFEIKSGVGIVAHDVDKQNCWFLSNSPICLSPVASGRVGR